MKSHKSIRDMVVFSMLAAILVASKIIFEPLPNIHPVSMLVMLYTVVYRKKALIPIYLFVLIYGLYYGFPNWWIPFLYIWGVQWAVTMLLPKNMPPKASMLVYPIVCALFGLTYGIMYAPTQALLYSYDFKTALMWISSGFYFDVLHAVGNFFMGMLILPLSKVLNKLEKQ